jgi:hypothetical protein
LLVSYSAHPANPTRGIDVIPSTRRGGGDNAVGFRVVALRSGYVTSDYEEPENNVTVGPNMVAIKGQDGSYELLYSHIIPREDLPRTFGVIWVNAGEEVGKIMDIRDEDPILVNSLDSHLHIQLREPAWSPSHMDPTGLISSWGDPGLIEP